VENNKDPYAASFDQAKEIITQTRNVQGRYGVAATAEIEQLRREYIERAQRRIDIYRENEQEHLETVMREMDEQRADKLRRIKIAYDNNNIEWVDEIFRNIITPD
jgi:gas vesicle protein